MSQKAYEFIKNLLGNDFLENLEKTEIYKPQTRTVIDPEEFHLALKVVPKAVMKMLSKELIPMSIGESKTVPLYMGNGATLEVKKIERDLYSGQLIDDNKKVAEFYSRSMAGVGLYILTTFELYDMFNEEEESSLNFKNLEEKVSKLIDEKLAIRDLVEKEVAKKIQEQKHIENVVESKISSLMNESIKKEESSAEAAPEVTVAPDIIDIPLVPQKVKGSPVVDYLKNRKKQKEFFVEIAKHEKVSCPDCRKEIFNDSGFSGCVCFGEDMNSKITIAKSEKGVKLSFGSKWEFENIQMLLEVLRSKK